MSVGVFCSIIGAKSLVRDRVFAQIICVVNTSPYEEGWIIKVELSDAGEEKNVMDSDKYSKFSMCMFDGSLFWCGCCYNKPSSCASRWFCSLCWSPF